MNVFDARLYFILFSRTLNERVNIKIITNGIINVCIQHTLYIDLFNCTETKIKQNDANSQVRKAKYKLSHKYFLRQKKKL